MADAARVIFMGCYPQCCLRTAANSRSCPGKAPARQRCGCWLLAVPDMAASPANVEDDSSGVAKDDIAAGTHNDLDADMLDLNMPYRPAFWYSCELNILTHSCNRSTQLNCHALLHKASEGRAVRRVTVGPERAAEAADLVGAGVSCLPHLNKFMPCGSIGLCLLQAFHSKQVPARHDPATLLCEVQVRSQAALSYADMISPKV